MIRKEFIYFGWYLLLCVPVIVLYVNFSLKAKKEWLTLTGQLKAEPVNKDERREYIRLESTFPVEFQKIDEEERALDIRQGFTRDISRTGMRLEAYTIRGKRLEDFVPHETRLKLFMNIPSEAETTVANGTVEWVTRSEDMTVDRYSIGISFDNIAGPDLDNIMKYVLWYRRKPDMMGISVAISLVILATFFSTLIMFNEEKAQLQRQIRLTQQERIELDTLAKQIAEEKRALTSRIKTLTEEREILLTRLRASENAVETTLALPSEAAASAQPAEGIKEGSAEPEKSSAEEASDAAPEGAATKEAGEAGTVREEPVVELRKTAPEPGDDIVAPNVTRKMVESEKEVYKTMRDYILAQEIQRLDRYCSTHASSIYHAAGLFALAELRYKNRSIREMTAKAYRDVINLYPRSKYASYSSHRIEQIERNLPYESWDLRYLTLHYNLPPLYDYRELEAYKE